MGVIDQSKCPVKTGSIYPEPYASQMAGRLVARASATAAGLTQFGANLVILAPGARSSLRHWHRAEDEFVDGDRGRAVLIQDEGEYVMRPGDCAAWRPATPTATASSTAPTARPASSSSAPRPPHEVAAYSDVDLVLDVKDGAPVFTYRDGTPWTGPRVD